MAYVLSFSWEREAHKQNSQKISGTVRDSPGKFPDSPVNILFVHFMFLGCGCSKSLCKENLCSFFGPYFGDADFHTESDVLSASIWKRHFAQEPGKEGFSKGGFRGHSVTPKKKKSKTLKDLNAAVHVALRKPWRKKA